MLFMDGEVSSLEYLAKQDSRLLDVASVEDIDVSEKTALAEEEVAVALEAMLKGLKWMDQPFWCRPKPTVESVVVTPPLKMWCTYKTLELVYEDAFFSQLNDRFKAKRDQFHEKARAAREKLIETGVGVVWNPVPQAKTPDVGTAPGVGLADGTYYVTVSWVNHELEEGACAPTAAITISGSLLMVRPADSPRNGTGWNVYVGTAPDAMFLQNTAPLDPGENWIQMTEPAAGRKPGNGQEPDHMQRVPRVLQRG